MAEHYVTKTVEFFDALCDKTEKDRQAVINDYGNIDIQDEYGLTVLMRAAFEGEKDIVKTLIKNKANLDLQNKSGYTALMLATIEGKKDIVEILIKNKANLDLQNKSGETALILATIEGEKDIVEILIKSKANLDLQNKSGETALILATIEGEKDIVEILIKNKANLDLQTKIGDAALLRATSRGYTDIVKMLVENGANLYLSNIVDHADVRYYANRLTRTKRLEILGILDKAYSNVNLQNKDAKKATKLVVCGKETPKKSETQAKSENQKKSKSDIQIIVTNVPNGKEKPTVLNCGTITDAQKQDFLAAISEHKPSDGDNHTCGFNVYYAKQSAMRVVPYEVSTNFQPTKQKIGKNELIVEMIPMSKKECGSWANYHCPICLASGNCTSPFIKKYIGKVLFPDKYGKQR